MNAAIKATANAFNQKGRARSYSLTDKDTGANADQKIEINEIDDVYDKAAAIGEMSNSEV